MIEPGDIRYLAELLGQLAGDRELRSRISREGRRLVMEDFSLEKNIAELEEIYERVKRDASG